MATIQETLDAVTASGDRLDSLLTLVEGLRKQISEVPGIPADVQAKIDAIFAEAKENTDKIDRALNLNVPPATPTQP